MKKQVLLLLGCASLVLYSCKKNQDAAAPVQKPGKGDIVYQFADFKKFVGDPIRIPMRSSDHLQQIWNQFKQNGVSIDQVVPGPNGKTLMVSSDEVPTLNAVTRTTSFIGAIYYGNSINDMTLRPIPNTAISRRPISVYADFPTDFIQDSIAVPSPAAQARFVRNALKEGTGEQISSFTYDMQRFYSFDELKLSFGANLNIGGIFTFDLLDSTTSVNKRTRIRAMFVQKNFTINMEPPADGLIINGPVDPALFGGYAPLIVSNVNYGRMGVMTIESDSSYEAVNFAVRATLNLGSTIGGGSIHLTEDQKRLLDRAKIKAYVIGADGTDAVKTVNGFDGFRDLILNGGKFSPAKPGVPISINLRYVSDFSPYNSKFELYLPN
jgi:thiol-activated cytolysin